MSKSHELGHHTFEADHIRKDGTIFPVYHDVTTVIDEEDRPLYSIVNMLDITDRKRDEKISYSLGKACR
ncbi:PAS domain S-box protein [Desulfotalea psychrophila]|uniref:PAS domain S-box protein n=1 Tax=Desulfotalea psychrophila TaxID=84980 RepID=UPI0038990457